MLIAPFRVVLDANVLYPFTLRDTLLRAADAELYQAYWSDLILDEVERNLVENGVVTAEQATRLRAAMEGAFPEAHVVNFEPFIDAMRNDQKDRHVGSMSRRRTSSLRTSSTSTRTPWFASSRNKQLRSGTHQNP
jgi:predicted nucleic acid-binding protein